MQHLKQKGFTIVELLIVIAIIGILVGVAVPYYGDYVYEARMSTTRQNAATFRNAINQFRGDNLRGPFAVPVSSGSTVLMSDDTFAVDQCELTAGPIQYDSNGNPARRSQIKYLPSMPTFTDPRTGGIITPVATGTTAYFYDADSDGVFDIDIEFAYISNATSTDFGYVARRDQKLYPSTAATTSTPIALDYTDVILKYPDSDENY